jgi:Flp pilus assembly protein TadD
MSKKKSRKRKRSAFSAGEFAAEAAYADSIFREAIGDMQGSMEALRRALEFKPDYAPAVLSLGSVEYQLGHRAEGRKLLLSLLSMQQSDWMEIVDKAGTFLIHSKRYADGLELYRAAAERCPDVGVFHQGIGCCADHLGCHEEALEASRRAVELEPDNQRFVNDLGWTLYLSGSLQEARAMLERAVAMDPTDELARENLRFCDAKLARRLRKSTRPGVASAQRKGTSVARASARTDAR